MLAKLKTFALVGIDAVPVEVGRRLDRADDRQAERGREVPVALVVGGHAHHRTGAVLHQHVVGDEHRQLLTVDRVGHRPAQRQSWR